MKLIMRFAWWGFPPPDCLPEGEWVAQGGPGGSLFFPERTGTICDAWYLVGLQSQLCGLLPFRQLNKKPLPDIRQRTSSFLPCSGMLILEKEPFFRQISVNRYTIAPTTRGLKYREFRFAEGGLHYVALIAPTTRGVKGGCTPPSEACAGRGCTDCLDDKGTESKRKNRKTFKWILSYTNTI